MEAQLQQEINNFPPEAKVGQVPPEQHEAWKTISILLIWEKQTKSFQIKTNLWKFDARLLVLDYE